MFSRKVQVLPTTAVLNIDLRSMNFLLLSDNIAEAGPVSPSAVPLPSAPPPASAKAASKKKENGGVKVMSVANPTPEQQKLQQQAQQYYHQQQLYYQQQVQTVFSLFPTL